MDLSFFLVVNSYVEKPERSALKKVNFNLLSFERFPYDDDLLPISLGDMNIILRAEMVF